MRNCPVCERPARWVRVIPNPIITERMTYVNTCWYHAGASPSDEALKEILANS